MLPLIGLAIGAAGTIGKMIGRGKANKKLNAMGKLDPEYVANPEAAKRLGLASTLLNARSPGAMAAERNIYQNQANTVGRLQRGATSSSQLLSMGADVQGQTNQDFNQLEQQETADYQRRYGNVEQAQEGVIREGDKLFADRTRRFQNTLQIQGAINENRQSNWSEVANLGFGLASFASGQGGGGSAPSPLSGNRYSGAGAPMQMGRSTPNTTITPRRG